MLQKDVVTLGIDMAAGVGILTVSVIIVMMNMPIFLKV